MLLGVVSVLQPLRTPWAHHLDMPHPATATRDLNHIHLVCVVPLLYHLASSQARCPMAALRYSVVFMCVCVCIMCLCVCCVICMFVSCVCVHVMCVCCVWCVCVMSCVMYVSTHVMVCVCVCCKQVHVCSFKCRCTICFGK